MFKEKPLIFLCMIVSVKFGGKYLVSRILGVEKLESNCGFIGPGGFGDANGRRPLTSPKTPVSVNTTIGFQPASGIS